MRVSIKDVAVAAGVSPATVSRALGGGPVRDVVRARVERAVAKTGYLPNLSARRLRSRHSRTIGLIVADIRNPFFTAVARAVEDVAYREHLRVILCNTNEDPEKEALYLKLMREERVTGVIFAPTRESAEQLTFDDSEHPVVFIDRASASRPCNAVVLDNRQAAEMLVEHLVANGYRNIAGLFGVASTTGVERRDGFVAAAARLGIAHTTSMIAHAAGETEAEVARLSAGRSAPDAIVASNGVMLLSVARAIRNAGLMIPDDIAVAGFDNEPWTELVSGGLTVIEQPVDEIGRTAMSLLLARIADPNAATRKVVLSGRCVVRGSSGVSHRGV